MSAGHGANRLGHKAKRVDFEQASAYIERLR